MATVDGDGVTQEADAYGILQTVLQKRHFHIHTQADKSVWSKDVLFGVDKRKKKVTSLG